MEKLKLSDFKEDSLDYSIILDIMYDQISPYIEGNDWYEASEQYVIDNLDQLQSKGVVKIIRTEYGDEEIMINKYRIQGFVKLVVSESDKFKALSEQENTQRNQV